MSGLDTALAAALALVGTPYLLGGLRAHPTNPRAGLDCSELVAYAFATIGINLPWNAQEQANVTQAVTTPQAGDLVFFHDTDPSNTAQYVTHVGIYLGGGKMVNAEDKGVAVSDISSGYWAQHLAGFGRVNGAGTATGAVAEPVGWPGWLPSLPTVPNPASGLADLTSRLQSRDTWIRAYLIALGATVVLVGAAIALWPVERPIVDAAL